MAMRTSRLLACVPLVTALAAATLALAQPPSRPARPAARADDKPAHSGLAALATSLPNDGGSGAPGPAEESHDGGRLSPLNPEASEFSDAAVAPSTTVDYEHLLADVASLRARVAVVSDTLFHSRLAIALGAEGDRGRIANLSVSLDDGIVWSSPADFRPRETVTVYDHAVAPGHHTVTVDVERRGDHNEIFRAAQRTRFVVEVPNDAKLSLELRVTDDSTMGADFPNEKRGRYDLGLRALAKAQPNGK